MDWLPTLFRQHEREAPSRFALFSGLLYTLLIVGVSLYPFQGWVENPDSFGAFLFYPWPLYFTSFDILINVAAYVPFGIFVATSTRQRLTLAGGLLAAMLAGASLSVLMELIQQYLPERIPSKLDLSCNTLGSLLGGVLVLLLYHHRGWRHFQRWRDHWLYNDVLCDFGLAVIGLWFFSQLDPAVPLFGVVLHPQGLPQPFISPIRNPALFLILLESMGAFLHLVGVGWLVATVLRRSRHGLPVIYAFFTLAIFTKLLFAKVLLLPNALFEWVNMPVAMGWLAGLLLFALLKSLKRIWQATLALLAIIGSIVVSHLWPLHASPMGNLDLFKWSFGQLSHFKGLVGLVASLWPYLAMIYLLWLIWILISRNPNQLP